MENGMNRLQELKQQGQSIWLDYIRRDILSSGELHRLIEEDGISGLTSNPAIFEQAIGGSDLYDGAILELLSAPTEGDVEALYEKIAIEDIRSAADILRPTYDATARRDGFVSFEVSPHLARDEVKTLAEASRLWSEIDRPNLMIKIPATREGLVAIEEALAAGINVNITLMFSLNHYEAVARAYLAGAARAGEPSELASVASFFVSRVDSKVDAMLEEIGSEKALSLRGKIGIANSKLAYRCFREIFQGSEFAELRDRGTAPQRVLWASTSTKNPAYRDVIYAEELIGPETVNTLPPITVDAFRDHGESRPSLLEEVDLAEEAIESLGQLGIDFDQVTENLQEEGLAKFEQPFDRLLETLRAKSEEVMGGREAV
jgi:transaldolase